MSVVAGNIEGNWPSYVYIKVHKRGLGQLLTNALVDTSKDLDGRTFYMTKSLHISLSKQFYLRNHHIQPFLDELGSNVGTSYRIKLNVGPSTFVLSNESESNHFLCLPITDVTGALQRLVHTVDETLRRFRQPVYHEKPIFHISIAETRQLADDADGHQADGATGRAAVGAESDSENDFSGDDGQEDDGVEGVEGGHQDSSGRDDKNVDATRSFSACTVYCKIGNRTFFLRLRVASAEKLRRSAFTEIFQKS